jgi:hypothetical protein
MERVVDNLKVPHGQHLVVRVFLLLRVLLLRMSEDSFGAWWPALLSESVCCIWAPC